MKQLHAQPRGQSIGTWLHFNSTMQTDNKNIYCTSNSKSNQGYKFSWESGYQLVISVTQSCLTPCDPMHCGTPWFPVHHQLPELARAYVHQVCDAILCHPRLLPPSIFPSMRVFSSESVLRIRWPKYWSFSFSISRSNEYLGLISFRI